jgi:hypothetical protein
MVVQVGSPVVAPRTTEHIATPVVASRATTDLTQSAVSWTAIFAGAAAAAVLSLLLVFLGFGLGLSSVSPWAGMGASAQAIGVATVLWLAFTQFAASGVGGYLAGRLRVKWTAVHNDEVYFRDTAHGFMAWAVASLVTAAMLGSTVAGVLDTGAKAGASMVAGAATSAAGMAAGSSDRMSLGYFTDSLYRHGAAQPGTPAAPAQSHDEAMRIVATDLAKGTMPDDDRQYLANAIAQETGMTPADATTRVNDVFAKAKATADEAAATAKQAADTARKMAASAALWMFVTLLIGAFIASYAATMGGRRRDLQA